MKGRAWGALAGASVIVLMFASAQGTGALWKSAAPISNDVLTAGGSTFALKVGSTVANAASTYTWSTFAGSAMTATTAVQMPLTIVNPATNNAALTFRLASVTATNANPVLDLKMSTVTSAANCPNTVNTGTALPGAQVYSGVATNAAYPLPANPGISLANGSSTVWCMRASVNMAETTLGGVSTKLVFTFTAKQS
ncbi:hypothetical protein R3Q08_04500 [Rhodococcus erythropolis]|nr:MULTISPECIES: hypothetical protein [Rhodococcus]MDJ0488595.1 hypothetical protein [Rhodococcus qingshengii]MDV6207482.1 hypothetical protein [Rhodococcus erythropolis]